MTKAASKTDREVIGWVFKKGTRYWNGHGYGARENATVYEHRTRYLLPNERPVRLVRRAPKTDFAEAPREVTGYRVAFERERFVRFEPSEYEEAREYARKSGGRVIRLTRPKPEGATKRAVLFEREACARVADAYRRRDNTILEPAAGDVARMIRERGEPVEVPPETGLSELIREAAERLSQYVGMCACPGMMCVESCGECDRTQGLVNRLRAHEAKKPGGAP